MTTMSGDGGFKSKQPLVKSISIVLLTVASLLMVPLVAMQFTNEVDWTLSDFVVMGVLLIGTGLTLVAALRMVRTPRNRAIACVAILGAFFLVWVELAVGLFGTPFAGS